MLQNFSFCFLNFYIYLIWFIVYFGLCVQSVDHWNALFFGVILSFWGTYEKCFLYVSSTEKHSVYFSVLTLSIWLLNSPVVYFPVTFVWGGTYLASFIKQRWANLSCSQKAIWKLVEFLNDWAEKKGIRNNVRNSLWAKRQEKLATRQSWPSDERSEGVWNCRADRWSRITKRGQYPETYYFSLCLFLKYQIHFLATIYFISIYSIKNQFDLGHYNFKIYIVLCLYCSVIAIGVFLVFITSSWCLLVIISSHVGKPQRLSIWKIQCSKL